MKVVMIGAGYVGLVSGACFSEFGHNVVCVDSDRDRVTRLRQGIMPIFEPGLEALVARNQAQSRLAFSDNLAQSVAGADLVFIAVGTPSRRGDGHADLSFVFEAARQIARALTGYAVIVDKSTVPVGTGRAVSRIVAETNPSAAFDVASNPEFLREGSAIDDFMRPNRVIIGVESDRAREMLRQLYRPLYLNETPILFTGIETAELTKYAANAFLAMKVSFINQMADLCEKVGADVQDVAKGLGLDQRIGAKFLHPGPGYGGSCFPKDTRALAQIAREAGVPTSLVDTTVAYNEARKTAMFERINQALGGSVAGCVIGILGLTFKPNTDDMREAPSLTILPALMAAGARVLAHDPEGMTAAKVLMPNVEYRPDPYEAARDADAVVLLTEWNNYRALDLGRLKAVLRRPVFIDLRNVYRPAEMRALGFEYHSLGRP